MDIRNHRFAWRWTDPDHHVLPPSSLARMHAVTAEDAARIFDQAMVLTDKISTANQHPSPATWSTRESADQSSAWLLQQQPDRSLHVSLSWDEETALITDWGIFSNYWPAFCYPASDELVVFPEDQRWVLCFFNNEMFQFTEI